MTRPVLVVDTQLVTSASAIYPYRKHLCLNVIKLAHIAFEIHGRTDCLFPGQTPFLDNLKCVLGKWVGKYERWM